MNDYKKTETVDVYESRHGDMMFIVDFDKKLWNDFKAGKFFFDFNYGDFLSKDVNIIGVHFIPVEEIDNEDDRDEVHTYKEMDIIRETDVENGYVRVKFSEVTGGWRSEDDDEEEDYEN